MPSSVDVVVGAVARHAVGIVGALFLISLGCWLLRNVLDWQSTAARRSAGLEGTAGSSRPIGIDF
jgi:hypothetical protein